MTRQNLKESFAGESQAHMKYLIFADRADRENKPNIARLFRAIAYAERVHATNHLKALGEVGSTSENLEAAKAGEDFEVDEMYPAYQVVAELQEHRAAARSMKYAVEAEKGHSVLYGETSKSLAEDPAEDVEMDELWVCPVCGYTVEGEEAPERCPVCNARGETFKKF